MNHAQCVAASDFFNGLLVIITLFGLILLVYSPVWYANFTGDNRVVVTRTEAKA
jgi:hypothetical protein